ncbi:FepA family TonB-dependent siderophore receptor [Bordetella sp. N]|uniref:FepA family TonB-dependent siderophore receptor n=1 Tax=Bordetella sp. N TaxID=1746199 RepID=UPI000B2D20DB|nr:FepA family TonB-dependent siderophore receptor [Bordetella sp. N]
MMAIRGAATIAQRTPFKRTVASLLLRAATGAALASTTSFALAQASPGSATPAGSAGTDAATRRAPDANAAPRDYDIAANSLDQVLSRFGQQSGVMVAINPSLTAGKQSPGLRGRYAPAQALSALLTPHGLQAVPAASGGYRLVAIPQAAPVSTANAPVYDIDAVQVLGTAEEELKQSLGVSVITAKDIQERPPANDLSELIRTVPGVNLTGASSSGAYGNQRQIDIRGMGPENTLVLIDGKPVQSREAALMRRSGERDTRGDTNWVPAEAVERIEVIRGPAAARYGSGAAGGVVNIITKKPTDKFTGSATTYWSFPDSSDEGATKRLSFNLAGPLSEKFSFRLYGNIAKTDADSPDINSGQTVSTNAAGREGTRNKDIDGLLRWDINPDHVVELEAGFSRQGNIYTGEYPVSTSDSAFIEQLADDGAEVRRTYRQTASVTHRGKWGTLGDSRLTFQYEGTRNLDCVKGTAGGPEGSCTAPLNFNESRLENYYTNGELHTPFTLAGFSQVLTTGFEYRHQRLNDPNSIQQSPPTGVAAVTDPISRADSYALYVEDNIEIAQPFILTPGLRFDHHDQFGSNFSPSLNATYEATPQITFKGGIARVFKAPNLYQSNPNYWYTTRGNGCPVGVSGPCYIQGNASLRPEVSVNKEIGVQWNNHNGTDASLTYFRNDYKNKIVADMYSQTTTAFPSYKYYQWYNAGEALIHGLEGNLNIPLVGEGGDTLKLLNNFTYMFSNASKETHQPLSVIPKYTINSTLDWRVTQSLRAQATATFYGRQKARTITTTGADATGDALASVSPYAIFGLGGSYTFDKHYRLGFGINNLFDKTIERRSNNSSAGAYTYNEPGRVYYLTATVSF